MIDFPIIAVLIKEHKQIVEGITGYFNGNNEKKIKEEQDKVDKMNEIDKYLYGLKKARKSGLPI